MVKKFFESYGIAIICLFAATVLISISEFASADDSVSIDKAKWRTSYNQLYINGENASKRGVVKIYNAASDELLHTVTANREGKFRWRSYPSVVPCSVKVTSDGTSDEQEVDNAPDNCDDGAGSPNQPPVAGNDHVVTNANTAVDINAIENDTDPDGDNITVTSFDGTSAQGASISINASGDLTYNPTGATVLQELNEGDNIHDTFTYTITDDAVSPLADTATVTVNVTGVTDVVTGNGISINSTSANNGTTLPASIEELLNPGAHTLLAANDLGMHCADLDYQIFSILPPFNVVHAQVIKRGDESTKPQLLDNSEIEVVYSAIQSPTDPALGNKTAADRGEAIYKSNFWEKISGDTNALWYEVYSPLYFGLLQPTDLNQDKGLPVPDSMKLAGNGIEPNCLEGDDPRAECLLAQALMPGHTAPYVDNEPQSFDRFDHSFNFFNGLLGGLGLGAVIPETNWFSEEGIPILPVDDEGRKNAYPLMRVQAKDKTSGDVLASADIVLPVASEADCQQCHALATDCATVNLQYDYNMQCSEDALDPAQITVAEIGDTDVPGATLEQQLLNAAKINILRLHDAKNGARYETPSKNADGSLTWELTQCTDGTQDSCLDKQRRIVCASCHYSPALDLAQLGPTDSLNTQQTRHISMSRAMHGHHGDLKSKTNDTAALFPEMPAPNDLKRLEQVARHTDSYPLAPTDTNMTVEDYVLQQSCYSCHPGKRTQCLRGAMASAGVVCQDCHGDMLAVGDDFTHDFPNNPGNMDISKRVPWAVEPGCQSCHVGDAKNQPTDTSGFIYAGDNIRLLRAYRTEDSATAKPIKSSDSIFAENQVINDQGKTVDVLYRLSKGHGGLMCEGCHGSTHAIWPNAIENANDNITAKQIQGHVGTITECTACHSSSFNIDDFKGSLDSYGRMKGPHGMHPVGSAMWNDKHKEALQDAPAEICSSCHGADGLGTVLSRTATDRVFECKENGTLCGKDQKTVSIPRGTAIGCVECHSNEISGRDDD